MGPHFKRRDLFMLAGLTGLRLAGIGGMGALFASDASAEENGGQARRTLILVELQGGNDGFNTVIPSFDPAYRRARPHLAIPDTESLPLEGGVRLHGALAPLMEPWNLGELAVINGIGHD